MFLVLCGASFAQTHPQWTSILSDQPETFRTQLISSSESSIQVNVQVPGFYTTTVTTPRGEAKIISMPKSVSTAQAGEPNLPMTGIPAIIGDHARMGIRVLDAQYVDFEGMEVAPSKGDFPRSIDPTTVSYTYGECYNQDAFFPASNVGLYAPYIIRDFRGQNMVVYPYAYNPVTKTLRVYYNMTVEMYKVDDKGENVMEARRSNTVKMDSDFKSLYQRHFINYEASMNRYTPVDEEGDLLIICYDSFISSMTDFVNWKKTRGVNTTIVGSSVAGSTSSALKTYIKNQYNANNNLTHVLLVGDVGQIPGYAYTGASGYTGLGDNPYGQVVGNDIYNDIFIGRFSAQNVAQVTTQVQRIITYERDLTTSATWCQNGLGVSASAGNNGHYNEDDYRHIENLRTDLLGFGYSTVYQDYKSVSGYPSSSTTTISNHINSGVGIINYCNHGSQTSWQSHNYSNSHVNALTNNNMLPLVFSVACYNGQYDYSGGDCFGEAWMHATNSNVPTGAIGGMFSYISQPWIPPMWAQDEFVDILVESYSNNIKYTFGGAAINGLFAIFDNYSTSNAPAVGTYQAWILYGDPTLMLRTKTPQAMNVSHAGTLTYGNSVYTVNVNNSNGAVATITNANHDILGSATVNGGSATINLSGSFIPGDELTLCVFGYNKVTYLGTIEVVGGTQYNLTCTQPEHGSISAPQQAYANATVTLAATPDEGYCLLAWDVRDANNNPITVTNNQFVMPESNVTVSATFIQGLNITMATVMNGSISANPSYALAGMVINLTATPASGYLFDSWVVYKTGDVNTTVTVNGNSFIMPNYDVTVCAIFLAPQGGDISIGSGTATNNGNYLPTTDYYKYSLSQQIYTQSELGGAGSITAISFYYKTSTSSNTRILDVYMTHTNSSTLTSWQTQSSNSLVFSGTHLFTQGWNTITLDTPFAYDGTSNLLLTVDDNTGNWTIDSYFYTYSTGANRAYCYRNDNTNPSPLVNITVTPVTSQYNARMVITKEVPSAEGYLSLSSSNLADFTYAQGEGPSTAQSLAVIGVNLQSNLTVTMPTAYEISSDGSTYASSLNLTPANGNLQQMIYVRLKANLNQGNYNGTMTLTSGSTIMSVTLSGEVTDGSGPVLVEQTVPLSVGWNWWSSYIELSDIDGLGQLENSISVPKAIIQSQNNGYVKSIRQNGQIIWQGELSSINNEEMYKIATKVACNATIEGYVTTPSEHPITINKGWNSIGFPCSQSVSVSEALSGFTPKNNDVIKGINSNATYNNGVWSGTLNTLEPGQGYMYGTKSNTPRTLVFQTGRGEATKANITPENNYYQPTADYADNMTVIAVVELDREELRSADYELAAFAGDECRGSVKLMYVESIDRYVAFLTVFGDQKEELRFVLTNGESMNWSDDPLTFTVDGIAGTLTEPATLHFGASVQDYVNVFPNPSNGVFNIEGKGIRKVNVVDAYGNVVLSKEVANDFMQIDLNGKAVGIYMLQVVTDNGITTRQLIKK